MGFRYFLRSCALTFVATLATPLTPHVAQAQPAVGAKESPDQRLTADKLLKQGVDMRKTGDDAGALNKFEQAYELAKTTRALAQMALAEQALKRWVLAEGHLTEVLADTQSAYVQKHRSALVQALRYVQQQLGWVRVKVTPPGATIRINGRELTGTPQGYRVAAGQVNVTASAPGYVSAERETTVGPGRTADARIELAKEKTGTKRREGPPPTDSAPVRPTAPSRSPDHTQDNSTASGRSTHLTWAWVSAGLGVVGLGVGTGFALRTLSLRDTRDDACPVSGCPDDATLSTAREADDSMRTAATFSTVGFIAGAIAGVTAITLFATVPTKQTHLSLVWRGGPNLVLKL